MSLLWFDSLHYASANKLVSCYPLATGFSVGGPHYQSGKRSIEGTSAALQVPASPGVGIGSDTAFIGYRVSVPVRPTSFQDHVLLRTGGATPIVRIQVGPSSEYADRVVFRVITGSSAYPRLLYQSLPLACVNRFLFLEWRIKLAVNGYVELRVDGFRDGYAENVDTNGGLYPTWNHVYIECNGSPATYRFSDLYVADGIGEQTFVGPVDVSRLFPARAQQPLQWSPDFSLTTKRYLVALFGQSNINGRGSLSPYLGTGRQLNTKVKIWDHNAPTPAWVDVAPGVACNNGTKTWSFEMKFADLAASLHEQIDPTNPAEIYIVRYGVDASYVIDFGIPGSGPLTWNPNVPNNISDAATSVMGDAVAAVGGWGSFERCDILWFQGESEGSGLGIGDFGLKNYLQATNLVFDHIEAAVPIPLQWHRAIIQNIPHPGFQNKFVEAIQDKQRFGGLRGVTVDASDLSTYHSDDIHMGPSDTDRFAERFYRSWLTECWFARHIQGFYFDNPALDDLWLGSNVSGSTVRLSQTPELQLDLMHNVVLAANNKMLRSSSADGKVLDMAVGGVSLPTVVLDAAVEWEFRYSQVTGAFAPEDLTGSLTFEIT